MYHILDTKCRCGNPECKEEVDIRRGNVYENNELLHSDQLFICINNIGNDPFGEVMLDPKDAKELMWNMIKNYMPGIKQAYKVFRFFRIQIELTCESIKSRIKITPWM